MAGQWFTPVLKTVSRGRGDAPATAKAAYRSGERIADERTGEIHDYRRRSGVEAAFLLAPESAPAWSTDRAALWNAAEQRDTRKNSVTARELMLPLPAELSAEARQQIAREVAGDLVQRYGVAVDVAIHRPHDRGDERNHHAHMLFTTRRLQRDGLGEKTRELDSRDKLPSGQTRGGAELEAIRQAAARATNRELERAGLATRVDHRSYERRGIEREAQQHMGPAASAMERKGKRTEVGDFNRAVEARNAEREALQAEAKIIDLALEREKREPPPWDRETAEIERQNRELEAADAAALERDRAEKEAAAKEAVERERGRFEDWAGRRRAQLQSRQLDDKGQLGTRHHQQRDNLTDQLAATYGPGIERAERTLAEVAEREKAGRVARFVYRLSGQAIRDHEQAEAARANLADIEGRMAEQRGKLERAQDAERTAQEATHRRQARALEDRITGAYQRREREGWQPLPGREPANDREKPEQKRAPETEWQRIQRLRSELHERERQQGRDGRDFERER